MLDLKAKLLAAGVVTAEQVQKVEADEAARRQRAKERREAEQRRRTEAPRGPRGDRHGAHDRDVRRTRDGERPVTPTTPPAPVRRERRDEDPDEKRARREHEWNEAQRWRKRLEQLKAAGKSEQYEAIRGWVMKDRVDDTKITEAAVRFHFAKHDGSVGHLTVEPEVQQRLTEGSAAVVAFMGYNGLEHAVVPRDVADDIRTVRPDWLRHLAGVTDAAGDDLAVAGDAEVAVVDHGAGSDDAPGRDDAPAHDDDPPLRDAGPATDEDAPPSPPGDV